MLLLFYIMVFSTKMIDQYMCVQDFYEMTLHHVATLVLMFFSWTMNLVRMGSLVILLHDVADPFLAVSL